MRLEELFEDFEKHVNDMTDDDIAKSISKAVEDAECVEIGTVLLQKSQLSENTNENLIT